MLEFFILGYIILIVYRCEKSPKNLFYQDSLSKKQTTFLRGVLAIAIIFHHLFDYTEQSNISIIFRNSGHLIVAVFFFLSGYGLIVNYKEKGENYLKKLVFYKLPELILLFVTIAFIYMIILSLIGIKINWVSELINLFGPNSIVKYSWFITIIIILYTLFFLVYSICKKHYMCGVIVICFSILIVIIYLNYLNIGEWWYDSLLAFPLGIVWALKEKDICSFCSSKYWLKLLILICIYRISFILAIYGEYTRFSVLPYLNITNLIISAILFTIIIIMLSMKIKIRNSIFYKLGTISLEIYLFQGLWIQIALKYKKIFTNEFIFIFVILIGILLTAYGFNIFKNFSMKIIKNTKINY